MKEKSKDESKLNEAYKQCLDRLELDFVFYKHFDFHENTNRINETARYYYRKEIME